MCPISPHLAVAHRGPGREAQVRAIQPAQAAYSGMVPKIVGRNFQEDMSIGPVNLVLSLHMCQRRHRRREECDRMETVRSEFDRQVPEPAEILSVIDINLDTIRLSPYQPRKSFDDDGLDELTESIRRNGVLQPVVVRRVEDGSYELVAGERRFRAAVQAGLKSIPAVARVLTDRESLEIALIENLQREDIKPMERAQAYRRLIDEFGLTQEQVAATVGKSRPAVANTLRLLNLPLPVIESVDREEISEGHARALLSIADPETQMSVWEKIVRRGLSVREAERLSRMSEASGTSRTAHVPRETCHGRRDPALADVEDKLRRYLGTKVVISRRRDKGRIEIEFYDEDDLMRILDLLASG